MACSKITLLASVLLILATIGHCAPAEKALAPIPVRPEAAGSKQDLAVEDKDDLKPAASHWGGGFGYGGYGGYGGWGHYGGYYPYYSSWGYPSYSYGYGWPYLGYGYGIGHGGYWW